LERRFRDLGLLVQSFYGLVAGHPTPQGGLSLVFANSRPDGIVEHRATLINVVGRPTIFTDNILGTLLNRQGGATLAAKDLNRSWNGVHADILACSASRYQNTDSPPAL
jgi:hypothetical protein